MSPARLGSAGAAQCRGGNESELSSTVDCLTAAMHVELAEDMSHVRLNGVRRQVRLVSDFQHREFGWEISQDAPLTFAKRLGQRFWRPCSLSMAVSIKGQDL